mgnify:CR=1 FL=1
MVMKNCPPSAATPAIIKITVCMIVIGAKFITIKGRDIKHEKPEKNYKRSADALQSQFSNACICNPRTQSAKSPTREGIRGMPEAPGFITKRVPTKAMNTQKT